MTIDVREATPEEYQEAGRVTATAYREYVRPGETLWEEYLEHIADVASRAGVATIVVALDGDRIVGSATLELGDRIDDDDPPLRPDEAHVRMLGVRPDARRRGVAAALLADIEDRARRAGRSRITLHTTPRMRPAQLMYERLGYRRLEDRVFPGGFVLLTYERTVPDGE